MRITTAQIEALRVEAAKAGDMEQVRVCDAALGEDEAAQEECARVIADAADLPTVQPLREDSPRRCAATVPATGGGREPCGARAVVLMHGRGGRCAAHTPAHAVQTTRMATS